MSHNLAYLNPGGVQQRKINALNINIGAARGLQEVLKTNLGPRGTMKMLVSGAGLVKITKDGNTLLGEMQIQHPTASLIARAATATDDQTGDGSTSTVLAIGEILRQSERYFVDGLHPRILCEGFDLAKKRAVEFLKSGEATLPISSDKPDFREKLTHCARSALCTKVGANLRSVLSAACVDAVLAIRDVNAKTDPIDLHMVEIMHMRHRLGSETSFINGIVLDHGGRDSSMPTRLENCYVLTCNISLEWERSELAAGFYYSDPSKKAAMMEAERKVTDDKVRAIIALKKQVCTRENGRTFVVINQQGIDGISLELLAREGILALRRAKRRNMERLVLACGGEAINSVEGLAPSCLGEAGLVREHTLGDEKYTFVEHAKKGRSCTLLIRGANDHTIAQIKDAVRDGLRAVKNAIDDGVVVPGAGAFEIALHSHLTKYIAQVEGKQKLGVQAVADAILCIPKFLAENGGHDVQDCLIALQDAYSKCPKGKFVGVNLTNGAPMDPVAEGVLDSYCVKRAVIETTVVIASQLLLVDEIMKAGRRGAGGGPGQQ